jgi:hypothetical protein
LEVSVFRSLWRRRRVELEPSGVESLV